MQPYLDTLNSIIREPTSNLTVAVLLLAAGLLLLLILILLTLVLVMPSRETADDQQKTIAQIRKKTTPRKQLGNVRLWWARLPRSLRLCVPIALVLATSVATYYESGTSRFCADACHQMDRAADTWLGSTHSEVNCIECHEGRLPGSLPTAIIMRSRYLVLALGSASSAQPIVPPDRCLSCHEGVLDESIETTAGIAMSHAEPNAAGIGCHECHQAMGHFVEVDARPSRMQVCLRCHNGTTASGDCSSCHIGDVGNSPLSSRIYRKATLATPTCGGCHDEASCDSCHGLRMPHSAAFIDGDHARLAAFDRKVLCWRCHRGADCGPCHAAFDRAHGVPLVNFKETHKRLGRDYACNGCHPGHEGPFCDRCH